MSIKKLEGTSRIIWSTYLKCILPIKSVEAYANVFKPIQSWVLPIYSTNYHIHHMTLPFRSFSLFVVALFSSTSLSSSLGFLPTKQTGLSYRSARRNSDKKKKTNHKRLRYYQTTTEPRWHTMPATVNHLIGKQNLRQLPSLHHVITHQPCLEQNHLWELFYRKKLVHQENQPPCPSLGKQWSKSKNLLESSACLALSACSELSTVILTFPWCSLLSCSLFLLK